MTGLPVRIEGDALAVKTERLSRRFASRTALRDLDLTVPEGAVYLLGGQNGAGKTTLFRILLDLIRPHAGAATMLGLDVSSDGARVRANVGYVPERPDVGHEWLPAGQLLRHHATYFPTWDDAYATALVRDLRVPTETPFGRLSKGEKRKAQLVAALAHGPAVLLLDEPTDGLDPLAQEHVLGVIAEHLAARTTTVIASTHLVHVLEGLADHLGVLHDGEFVFQAERDLLTRRLRRYTARVPETWGDVPDLNGAVVRREGDAREIAWTIWGDEPEVVAKLTASGAELFEVSPLNLERATLSLLAARE